LSVFSKKRGKTNKSSTKDVESFKKKGGKMKKREFLIFEANVTRQKGLSGLYGRINSLKLKHWIGKRVKVRVEVM